MKTTPAALLGLLMILAAAGFVGWLLWRAIKRSYDAPVLITQLGVTLIIVIGGGFVIESMAGDGSAAGQIAGVLIGLVLGLFLGMIWVPVFVSWCGDFIGGLWTGGNEPPPPQPYYSIADTRVKQGKYREALYEIQQQLEKFPNDVTGQMKQAEIHARQLNDLPAAQVTIDRFCNQPGHPPVHLAQALNSLADWHLKAQDPDSARAALERIQGLLPNTEFSNAAAQRIAHLASKEMLLANHESRPIHLAEGVRDLGLRTPGTTSIVPKGQSPEEVAQQLVHHLQAHPLDNEARERLATVYAEHYQRPDLAIQQLEELISAPNQPGKEVARWLNTVADFQLRAGADYDTILATLHRVVEKLAGSAAADLALQRIEHLRLEIKGRQVTQVIKMGTYEKDIGLKQSRRR